MSNPDTAAAQDEFPEDDGKTTSTAPSFDTADYEQQVVTAVNEMEFDDTGKWVPPEDMSPEMRYAVNSERRRRDTQSAHEKVSQKLSASEVKTKALMERLESAITPNLSVEEAEELQDLKETNPDAWRAKLNELDAEAYEAHQEELDEIDQDASQTAEETRRTIVLNKFLSDNPELTLNDNVFENDLPQGLTGKLIEGEITFEDFLDKAKEFLQKGAKIAGSDTKTEKEPDLSASSGSSQPAAQAVKLGAANAKEYENEIF